MSIQRKYDVMIGSHLVNTVYNDEVPAKELRKSLINHDSLPITISVFRYAVGRFAYDDMARASYPEEL